jgi:hypothetical protein
MALSMSMFKRLLVADGVATLPLSVLMRELISLHAHHSKVLCLASCTSLALWDWGITGMTLLVLSSIS